MMRFFLTVLAIAGAAGMVASQAPAKDAAVKAGYCKMAATKLAAGCTPVLPTPCCCVPSNEHANGKGNVARCTEEQWENLTPCSSKS
jgi:hypothetical protein